MFRGFCLVHRCVGRNHAARWRYFGVNQSHEYGVNTSIPITANATGVWVALLPNQSPGNMESRHRPVGIVSCCSSAGTVQDS